MQAEKQMEIAKKLEQKRAGFQGRGRLKDPLCDDNY